MQGAGGKMESPAEVSCANCNQHVKWSAWRGFAGLLDREPFLYRAETRRGTCGCVGKGYVQARPPEPEAQAG